MTKMHGRLAVSSVEIFAQLAFLFNQFTPYVMSSSSLMSSHGARVLKNNIPLCHITHMRNTVAGHTIEDVQFKDFDWVTFVRIGECLINILE